MSEVSPKNKLNELNGKEWIKFTKSWFINDATHAETKEKKEITGRTHAACVDEETECLTQRGWKDINTIQQGDYTLSYNIKTGTLEWKPILDVFKYKYDGDMVGVEGRRLSMRLTPDHNVIVKTTRDNVGFRKAKELVHTNRIPCSAPMNWDTSDTIQIDPSIAALLGWFISEGHFYTRKKDGTYSTIVISQSLSANPQYVEEIERLLNNTNAHYKKYVRNRTHKFPNNVEIDSTEVEFYIRGEVKDTIVKLLGGEYKKTIPKEVLLWDKDSIELFFSAMIKGDGSYRKESQNPVFCQMDKTIVDQMQIIGIILGYDSTLIRRKSDGIYWLYFNKYSWKYLRNAHDSLLQTMKYNGMVWCPYVKDNHSFVARRNGRIFITGNSFPVSMVQGFIEFFTKSGQYVLDPFAGIGSTLKACHNTGRKGIGIELCQDFVDIINKWGKSDNWTDQRIICGDARNIPDMDLPEIDYCITSPPYWDMLHRSTKDFAKDVAEKGSDIAKYNEGLNNVGNIKDYDEFLDTMVNIFYAVYNILKPKGYLTVIVKNIVKGSKMYPLAWDLGKRLGSFYVLKQEKIWCQDEGTLAPFGYPYRWVSNTHHHYCLILSKE